MTIYIKHRGNLNVDGPETKRLQDTHLKKLEEDEEDEEED